MRTTTTAGLALAGLLLSGCSGDVEHEADRTGPSTAGSTTATSPSTDEASDESSDGPDAPDDPDGPGGPDKGVRATLRAAVIETIGTGVVDFTYDALLAGASVIRVEGVQHVETGWSATGTFDDPTTDGPDRGLTMHARSADGHSWMQMVGWPATMAGCWLLLGPRQVPLGISGLRRDEAAYVSMLLGLHAHRFVDGWDSRIEVEIPFRYAQAVVQQQVLALVDLEPRLWRQVRVPAVVGIESDRVSVVEVAGTDLVDAIAAVGGTIDPQAAQVLAQTDYTVSFPASGPRLEGPPAPDLVVTAAQMEQGCH